MDLVEHTCTHCGAALPPAAPGSTVRCGYCGHTFEAAAPLPPPPEVVRVEIVAPTRAMRAAPRPSAGGCLLGPVLALAIGGFAFYQVRKATSSIGAAPVIDVGGVHVTPPSLGSSRLLWDDVGGAPAPVTSGGQEAVVGRLRMEDDQLYVAAIEAATAHIKWRFGPLGTYSEGYQHTHFGIVHDHVLVTDAHSVVHVVDPANGKETAKASFTDRIEKICVARPAGTVWVGTIDKRGATLDPATGATHAAPRPASCDDTWTSRFESDRSMPATPPKVTGFQSRRVVVDGDVAVASGYRSPGTAVPTAVGFDPKSGAVHWNNPVPTIDPASVRERSNEHEALAAGRFVTIYGVTTKGWHLTALDARSGARLWDTAMRKLFAVDSIGAIAASASYVYVTRTSSLDIYDAKTGRLIGAVGNETYRD